MGITGELVRSVFSKSRSTRTHDTNVKSNVVEKKRWRSSVRAYLCGDELFNSVLAEEDAASVRSSEATVTQPVPGEDYQNHTSEAVYSEDQTIKHESSDQDHSDLSFCFRREHHAAAIIIQAAFRGFMIRRLRMSGPAGLKNELFKGLDSSSRESLATSIEVQTGNSIGVVSIYEEIPCVSNKLQHKSKTSVFRPKDDWDDSTVDSSVSKMRVQNRLEAMTRRERALAYAFSQQLRICSKKKPTMPDSTEPNMGWSWLERWMATRQPEGLSAEDSISKQLNELTTTMKTKPIMKNKFLDLSFEGKESCGSNEVPIQVDASVNTKTDDKDVGKAARNRLKAPRNISRRKTVPTGHYQKEHAKVIKRDGSREGEKDKRQKVKLSGGTGPCQEDTSQSSPDHSVAVQNSISAP